VVFVDRVVLVSRFKTSLSLKTGGLFKQTFVRTELTVYMDICG